MSEGHKKIEILLEELKSKNNKTKLTAQRTLFQIGKNHIDYLINTLPSETIDVQCVICQVLGLSKNPIALESLLKLFEHENATVRCFAAAALGRLKDERSIIPLTLALSEDMEENPLVRAEVASSLGRIGNRDAVEPLINSLLNDHDKEVRSKTALALGLLGDKRAVDPLIERFGLDYFVQRNAAIALGYLKDKRGIEPLVRLLPDQILGEIAYYALAKIDNSFLEMSKDEIIQKYKKIGDGVEKNPEEISTTFDLDKLLANVDEKNPDDDH